MPTVAELSVTIDAEDNATATIERLDALLKNLGTGQTNVQVDAEVGDALAQLDEIQAQTDALDADTVSIPVEVDSAAANAQVDALMAQLSALSRRVSAHFDIDAEAAIAELDALEAQLAVLDNRENIQIDADVAGAMAKVAALKAELMALGDKTVNVDTDTTGLNRLTSAASRASTQVNAIAMAVLLLGPVLVPIFAVASAAVGAFALALTAALTGAVLFAGVAISAFSPIAKALTDMEAAQKSYNMATTDKQRDAALEKLKNIYDSLDPAQQKVFNGVTTLKTAWAQFVAIFQPDIFELAGRALTDMGNALPSLVPLMDSMTRAAGSLLTSLEQSLGSPFWQSFLQTINQIAGPAMESMVRSIGNIITGIAGMLQAFEPFAMKWGIGFENMTKRFSDWGTTLAQNPGFKVFMDYVNANAPGVINLISELWDALKAIVEAAAPIGTVLVSALIGLFDWIQKLNDTNPNLLTLIIAMLGIGAAIVNLVGPFLTITRLFLLLGTTTGAVIAAIGLIVVGLIYAYTHFDTFKNIVDTVVQAIVSFAQQVPGYLQAAWDVIMQGVTLVTQWFWAAWAWVQANVVPIIMSLVQSVLTEFQKWQDWWNQFSPTFQAAWDNILGILQTAWGWIQVIFTVAAAVIIGIWNALWPVLAVVLQQTWELIKGVISGALEIIRGIITVVLALIAGDWGAAWDGIVMIFQGAYDIIASIAMALGNVLVAILQAAWSLIWAGVQAFWSMVTAAFSAAMGALAAIVSAGWNAIVAIYNATTAACEAIVRAMWIAIVAVFNATMAVLIAIGKAIWAGLQEAFNMGKTAVLAVWDALWKAVETAVNAAKSAITAAIRALLDAGLSIVTGFTGQFTNAGAALIRAMGEGVKAAAQAVVDSVQWVLDKASALIPHSPAKKGPFSGSGWTYTRGAKMSTDLADGIESQAWRAAASMQDLADLAALNFAPQMAYSAITTPTSGTSVTVAPGAVVVQMPDGTTPDQASAMMGSAGDQLAEAILIAIRRR